MIDADTVEIRLPDWVTGARLALPAPSTLESEDEEPRNETPAQKRERLIKEQREARNARLARLGAGTR